MPMLLSSKGTSVISPPVWARAGRAAVTISAASRPNVRVITVILRERFMINL